MDPVAEKESMLARCGSFWYRTLTDGDKKIARTMTGFSSRMRLNRLAQQSVNRLLSGGYHRDNYIVQKFKPGDVFCFGIENALQVRDANGRRGTNLVLPAGAWLENAAGEIAAEDHAVPVLFPATAVPGQELHEVVFPGNYRARFCAYVDKDLFIETIRDGRDRLLMHGVDFVSTFGAVWMRDNPMHLFPDLRIRCESAVKRTENLYSYTLQLDGVYGPVDRIVEYYRGHQTPRTFYLAAAQAAGFPVVRKDGVVASITPLFSGCAYTLTDGTRYDAPFKHTHLSIGDEVKAEQVIGGDELFTMYGPQDAVPNDVTEVCLGYAFPVHNLVARSETGRVTRGGIPAPLLHGVGVEKYEALLPETGEEEQGNVLTYVMDTLLGGRRILVRINEAFLSRTMQIRLDTFMKREVPMGAVLTYAPLTNTIR